MSSFGSIFGLALWLELMNKPFPRLEYLSLSSTTTGSEEMSLVAPELLQAPRYLSLHGIGLPKGLSSLSSTTALSTLSLTRIPESCYFPPAHLVTQLHSLPRLVELSIGFALPIPLPSGEGEPLSAPIPPVTMPTLRQFTFQGEDIYLDNVVAHINTPLLKRLSVTLLFDLVVTLENLTKFIQRTEGLDVTVSWPKSFSTRTVPPYMQIVMTNRVLGNSVSMLIANPSTGK
ncbi:hypothetical protein BJV77DRAFT_1066101 [Russula vinacea]|nr:hypothetical protein BJV77DRAFT_1066101 [Russula vinacea]